MSEHRETKALVNDDFTCAACGETFLTAPWSRSK